MFLLIPVIMLEGDITLICLWWGVLACFVVRHIMNVIVQVNTFKEAGRWGTSTFEIQVEHFAVLYPVVTSNGDIMNGIWYENGKVLECVTEKTKLETHILEQYLWWIVRTSFSDLVQHYSCWNTQMVVPRLVPVRVCSEIRLKYCRVGDSRLCLICFWFPFVVHARCVDQDQVLHPF